MSLVPLANSGSTEYDAESSLNIAHKVECLSDAFREREGEEFDDARADSVYMKKERFNKWRDWYIENYPHTDPISLVEQDGRNVDIRVLFMACEGPAYAILLFLEACYEVDKAICGMDPVALESIKRWYPPHDFRAYTYLLSEDTTIWWKRELCELSNEIHAAASNQVSLTIRVRSIANARYTLERAVRGYAAYDPDSLDHIGSRIITVLGEECMYIPTGLTEAIYGRQELLADNVKILQRELVQMQLRPSFSVPVVRSNAEGVQNNGLRRRIPQLPDRHPIMPPLQAAPLFVRSQLPNVGRRHVPQNVTALAVFDQYKNPQVSNSHERLQSLELVLDHVWESLSRAKSFLRLRRGIVFLTHEETSFMVFSFLVASSAVFMAISANLASSPSSEGTTCAGSTLSTDPNFFNSISQTILTILSIYLMILPIIWSRTLGLQYRFWFWTCLVVSSLAGILSVILYRAFPMIAGVLGWMGMFAQVAITMLLAKSIRNASRVGNIDGFELSAN